MTGKIIIFKNNRKTKENHPAYVGTITDASGVESEVALWVKDGKNGKFFAGQIKDKSQRNIGDLDNDNQDDLPF